MNQCKFIVSHLKNDHRCNIDIIYVVTKESCHSSIPYGLPKILTPFW
jgi:hypothetical protein